MNRKQVKVRFQFKLKQLKELTARAQATGQSDGQYLKALVVDDIQNKRLKLTYV